MSELANSENLKKLDREAIRARAEAATPGPWWTNLDGCCVLAQNDAEVCERSEPTDAAFIAAAREAVPALLDACDALARALLEHVDPDCSCEGCIPALALLDRLGYGAGEGEG